MATMMYILIRKEKSFFFKEFVPVFLEGLSDDELKKEAKNEAKNDALSSIIKVGTHNTQAGGILV
jgi:ubiquitin carboxyl-terminal hydrolase 9/24